MISKQQRLLLAGAITTILAACGGGSGGSTLVTPPQTGNVSMLISDASNEDWATIGVKVLSIALVPADGSANQTVYTAPAPAPVINLVELDQLGELIGNASIKDGTYTGAVVTIAANPGDVLLTVAADPEAGFAGTPGATIPSGDIQIQHAQGSAPNLTVTVPVSFDSPLVVNANQNNQLDLEFDLGHPALILGHVPPGSATTLWAVNFKGPVRHHPIKDITRLVLRHMYGDVTGIDANNHYITVAREFPTLPASNPEMPVMTSQSVQVLADPVNGTIVYDMDAKTKAVVTDFSTESALNGKQVRIAARYQQDGTLVATRIWASNSFATVWLSPEGHVLHVDTATDVVTIANEDGKGVPMVVDANTQFFLRKPENGQADATPIATGTAFLANHDLVRGFKVHANVVDVTAVPLVAQSIDIETPAYSGRISAPDATGFTYAHTFRTATDDYTYTLDYIAPTTPNGKDAGGNQILGYKWWNFAFPTLVDSGNGAISDFVAATKDAVDFGGTVGAIPTYGVSYAAWNDTAAPNAWSARATVLLPSAVPLGSVATGLANNAFTMTVNGGTTANTIDISTTAGSATLVYQVDRSNGIVTVSPVDITTQAGLATLTTGLAVGTPVKAYGIPQSAGMLNAYVLVYFTGTTLPTT